MPTYSSADETIVAVATPPGKGAIAVVRVSGRQAHAIVRQHVTPWPAPRRATLCTVRDGNGERLDQGVVTVFDRPHSFTGEDVVEIATHGGLLVPTLVAVALIGSGARQAEPGEFTRRAVLNGQIDLTQAEAIGDLIDATSHAMHRVALQQLDGGLSRRIAALRDEVIGLEALIAYDIDFPEEDDGPVPRDRITAVTARVGAALDALLATAPAGELIRAGAVVVIAGPTNAGKSSLFNALLGAQRAIVTHVPGTTRDAIEAVIDTGRWPVRLVDTAGLRETADVVERIGIEVSAKYLAGAHLVLGCGDTDASARDTARVVAEMTSAPVLEVRTKADVTPSTTRLHVSAETGEGLDALRDTIDTILTAQYGAAAMSADTPLLTRERHQYAIRAARDEIAAFDRAWRSESLPAPVAAVHLHTAIDALSDVIGLVDVEEIFDRLFRTFCIGK